MRDQRDRDTTKIILAARFLMVSLYRCIEVLASTIAQLTKIRQTGRSSLTIIIALVIPLSLGDNDFPPLEQTSSASH